MLDKVLQHGYAVAASDHLRVHGHGEDAILDMLVHPVKVALPDLQHLARGRGAVAVGGEVELKVDPVIKLKTHRQFPKARFGALDQRRLRRHLVTDAGVLLDKTIEICTVASSRTRRAYLTNMQS